MSALKGDHAKTIDSDPEAVLALVVELNAAVLTIKDGVEAVDKAFALLGCLN